MAGKVKNEFGRVAARDIDGERLTGCGRLGSRSRGARPRGRRPRPRGAQRCGLRLRRP